MAHFTRRCTLKGGFAVAAGAVGAASLSACGAAPSARSSLTHLHVMGTIHRRHRTSETYSLAVLKDAILKAHPDVILTEIPPDRVAAALQSFEQNGAVDEPRTNVFPEYTDVIIPLAGLEGWRVIGCAAWTPDIARNRAVALTAIRNDPVRSAQWAEHSAATRAFAEKTLGRSDDPLFVHTPEFDRLVAASREPYARYFDADLGSGGWTQINDAHNALINAALDGVSGQGLRALITFGSAHKHKILESLAQRGDTEVQDTRALFA